MSGNGTCQEDCGVCISVTDTSCNCCSNVDANLDPLRRTPTNSSSESSTNSIGVDSIDDEDGRISALSNISLPIHLSTIPSSNKSSSNSRTEVNAGKLGKISCKRCNNSTFKCDSSSSTSFAKLQEHQDKAQDSKQTAKQQQQQQLMTVGGFTLVSSRSASAISATDSNVQGVNRCLIVKRPSDARDFSFANTRLYKDSSNFELSHRHSRHNSVNEVRHSSNWLIGSDSFGAGANASCELANCSNLRRIGSHSPSRFNFGG